MNAARRYKDVIAELTGAGDSLTARNRARTEVLTAELTRRDAEMVRAGDRFRVTGYFVELHWEAAVAALWVESWMTFRPRPEPDPGADPADLDALDMQVEQRAAALQEAVRSRGFDISRG